MLPWAPRTAAGGSCGKRAQGQRALIPSEHPQGQPRTPPSCSKHSLEGLAQTPRPWGSSPCPLVPCPPAVMQLGGHSSPTASPTPPLLIRICVPTAWKGQEGSPNFGKCRTTTINPAKSQDTCLSQHPCHCPALPRSRFFSSHPPAPFNSCPFPP